MRTAAVSSSAVTAAAISLLLAAPSDLHAAGPAEAAAVAALVRAPPAASLASAVAASDGRWEVVYAPHIQRLSAPFAATIKPLRYTLSQSGTRLRSDVLCSAPFGSSWLSAEGRVELRGDAVDVLFESFWVRSGEAGEPLGNPLTSGAPVSALDSLINAVGRLGFVPSLSRFPVRYIDSEGLTVFEYPPLATTIAARRVSVSE